jgi:acyl-CoA thioester hydrolase
VLLADGTIRIGCVDAGTFRPTRIPISIVESVAPNENSNG